MKMTNYEIYTTTKALEEAFSDNSQYLPIKISFFIQKNKANLLKLAQAIDVARLDIVRNYGQLDEESEQFIVPADQIDIANNELSDLFNIEQEVEIHKIDIDVFPDDVSLTNAQMEALMFMIN